MVEAQGKCIIGTIYLGAIVIVSVGCRDRLLASFGKTLSPDKASTCLEYKKYIEIIKKNENLKFC